MSSYSLQNLMMLLITQFLMPLGRANIDYESHCCMGWCGTCRVVLVSGQVRYPGGKPLGYIRDGEILPCCCVPTSDIEIRTLF